MRVKFSDVEGHLLKVSLTWLCSFTILAQILESILALKRVLTTLWSLVTPSSYSPVANQLCIDCPLWPKQWSKSSRPSMKHSYVWIMVLSSTSELPLSFGPFELPKSERVLRGSTLPSSSQSKTHPPGVFSSLRRPLALNLIHYCSVILLHVVAVLRLATSWHCPWVILLFSWYLCHLQMNNWCC